MGGSESLSGMACQRSFRPSKLRYLGVFPGEEHPGTLRTSDDPQRSRPASPWCGLDSSVTDQSPSRTPTHTLLLSSMPGQGALAPLLSDRRRRACSAEPFSATVRLVCGLVDGLKTCL